MTGLLRCAPFDYRYAPLYGALLRQAARRSAAVRGMRIDVEEDDQSYRVHAEIPGVKKEDIKVTVEAGEVTISAEAKREEEVGDGPRVLRAERYAGKWYRRFQLAKEIDEAAVEASYVDGVLHLTLPKKSPSAGRKIEIN